MTDRTPYQRILQELLAQIRESSVGLIVVGSRLDRFRVLAAHGLGVEPLRTLRGMSGGLSMLDAAVRQGCWVTQHGEQATWTSDLAPISSARARWARATLHSGMAYPISWEGAALGAIGWYGSRLPSVSMEARARSVIPLLGLRAARHLMGIG